MKKRSLLTSKNPLIKCCRTHLQLGAIIVLKLYFIINHRVGAWCRGWFSLGWCPKSVGVDAPWVGALNIFNQLFYCEAGLEQ